MSTNPAPRPYPDPRPYKKKVGPDSAAFGLLVGIICPFVGLLIVFLIWSGTTTFGNYIKMFTAFGNPGLMNTASKAVSLATIINLAPFYFFLNRKQYLTVRGILLSMALFGVVVVLYKFVWQ